MVCSKHGLIFVSCKRTWASPLCFGSLHYRTRPICRVQKDLPSAFCQALDKGNLCREADPAALGKDRPSANMPLPRVAVGKKIFAECRALGKIWPLAKVAGVTTATCRQPLPLDTRQRVFYFYFLKILCRVPCDLALGKGFFAECQGWLLAN